MQAGQDITVGGRLEQAQYQYTLTDTNAAELNHWAPMLLQKMQGMKVLTDVASDLQIAPRMWRSTVDRNTAYRARPVDRNDRQTLYDAFGQSRSHHLYATYQSR